MQVIKRSTRAAPKVSLVLVDWSVRESFHLLHYLNSQTANRELFEVTIVEFHDRVSDAVRRFEETVDNWIVLDVPRTCYYHKHLMYNAGIVISRGEIIMIGDSDAMVRPTFIQSIIDHFDREPRSVFHIDQFRNHNPDFYPFNYPSFEDVLGKGCGNNVDGKTIGIRDIVDPIHTRNYGAAMCARRDDLIAIGGADMHAVYLGHICGPYDMTFRLINFGRRVAWSTDEFSLHTWHPGEGGIDNYVGPHDGRNMSTVALESLVSRRVAPLVESPAIAAVRQARTTTADAALALLIDPEYFAAWHTDRLPRSQHDWVIVNDPLPIVYKGFRLFKKADRVVAYPVTHETQNITQTIGGRPTFESTSTHELQAKIDKTISPLLAFVLRATSVHNTLAHISWMAVRHRRRILARLIRALRPRKGDNTQPLSTAMRKMLPSAGSTKISELAMIIDNLVRCGSLSKMPSNATILVDYPRVAAYFRILGWLRLLPQCRALRVRNLDDYRHAYEMFEKQGWPGYIFVTKEIHIAFHEAISGRPVPRRWIIV